MLKVWLLSNIRTTKLYSTMLVKGKSRTRAKIAHTSRSLNWFLKHEATESILTLPWMGC